MIHNAATEGYSRGAARYARARPPYHPDILDEAAALAAGGLTVELGAGTGIATVELLARRVHLVAVEPVPAMRAELARAALDVDVRDGTAEAIPFPDGAVAAVVVAQAFHWFDAPAALDDIARVLAPGGHLVLLWNVAEDLPWVQECTAVIDRYADGAPRRKTMAWRHAIDADQRYDLQLERSVSNSWEAGPEDVLDRFLSTSFIAALDDAEQAAVASELRRVVAPLGERFDFPYRSELQAWVVG